MVGTRLVILRKHGAWHGRKTEGGRAAGLIFQNGKFNLHSDLSLELSVVMNAGSVRRVLCLVASCLLLSTQQGCDAFIGNALHGDTLAFKVDRRGDDILFHIPGGEGAPIILEGLSVSSIHHHRQDATVWSIDVDPAVPQEKRVPIIAPIIYGQEVPGLLTDTPAKKLIPGGYFVYAYFFFRDREHHGSIINTVFTIGEDGAIGPPPDDDL